MLGTNSNAFQKAQRGGAGGSGVAHFFLLEFRWQLFVSDLFIVLLLNEGIPRAYQGKKLRLNNILFFPSKSEGITCRF